MKRKNNLLSIAIGALIGTLISAYAAEQQSLAVDAKYIEPKQIVVIRMAEVEEAESPEEVIQEKTEYFDVPLSEELQDHIFAECEKHNISPAIVISMIEQESDYDAMAVGDKGNSQGLMQIQKKWHQERMDKLGCTDLLDPFQNITVGIDYLAELKGKNSELYWVLMAYNGGCRYANRRIESGNISNYAIEVAERAEELEGRWNNGN
jgi:soluble lytic murein transglycosylase-like protein